jgi:uncharacterized protein YidB (DUF937 family)
MAFIDLLINETALKFELENKSIAVVSALISTMNNKESGGVEGFLDRFRNSGLADTVAAWVNEAEQISLSADDVEIALGPFLLRNLCEKTGVNNPLLAEIFAFLIPPVICHLSSNRLTLAMRPDEMRKALWTVPTEVEAESGKPNFPAPAVFSSPNSPDQTSTSFINASSIKLLSSKLLRSFPF